MNHRLLHRQLKREMWHFQRLHRLHPGLAYCQRIPTKHRLLPRQLYYQKTMTRHPLPPRQPYCQKIMTRHRLSPRQPYCRKTTTKHRSLPGLPCFQKTTSKHLVCSIDWPSRSSHQSLHQRPFYCRRASPILPLMYPLVGRNWEHCDGASNCLGRNRSHLCQQRGHKHHPLRRTMTSRRCRLLGIFHRSRTSNRRLHHDRAITLVSRRCSHRPL